MIREEDIKEGLEFCVKRYDPESHRATWLGGDKKPKIFRITDFFECAGQQIANCAGENYCCNRNTFTSSDFCKENGYQLAVYAKDVVQKSEELGHGSLEVEVDADEGIMAFSRILKTMIETYVAKNHDYGNAFSEIYEELGIDYGYGKIREKVNRIKTLKDKPSKVKGEPLEDALLDCANYCILTLVEYQKRKKG